MNRLLRLIPSHDALAGAVPEGPLAAGATAIERPSGTPGDAMGGPHFVPAPGTPASGLTDCVVQPGGETVCLDEGGDPVTIGQPLNVAVRNAIAHVPAQPGYLGGGPGPDAPLSLVNDTRGGPVAPTPQRVLQDAGPTHSGGAVILAGLGLGTLIFLATRRR